MPSPTPTSLPPRRRTHTIARVLRALAVMASVALFARVVVQGGGGLVAALKVLWQQQPMTIAVLLALVTTWIMVLAQVQRSSARYLGADLSHRDAFRISRAAFTLSRVVPGGGAAGGVFAIRELVRLGHRPGLAGGTALVSWAVTAVAFAALVLAAATVALASGVLPAAAVGGAVTMLVGLAAAALVLLWAVRHDGVRRRLVRALRPPVHHHAGRVRGPLDRVRMQAADAVSDLDDRGPGRGSLPAATAWAATAYVCDIVILWTVLAAVGAPVSPGLVAAGFLSAGVINTVPEMTPGWIGVYEAAMTATYTALGVPADVAVVATLLHRLVTFWLPVAVGILPAVRSLGAGRHRRAVDPIVLPHPDEHPVTAGRTETEVAA